MGVGPLGLGCCRAFVYLGHLCEVFYGYLMYAFHVGFQ